MASSTCANGSPRTDSVTCRSPSDGDPSVKSTSYPHLPIRHDDLYLRLVRVGPHPEPRAQVPDDPWPGVYREGLGSVVRDSEVRLSCEIDGSRRHAVVRRHAELAVRAQHDPRPIGELDGGATPSGGGELAHRGLMTHRFHAPHRCGAGHESQHGGDAESG